MGLPTTGIRVRGLFVYEVLSEAAEAAGVQENDVLLKLGGNRLYSIDNVRDFLQVTSPGVTVELELQRFADPATEGEEASAELHKIELELEPGTPKPEGIDWQFASLEQLDDALAAARKGNHSVLVGISGAET